MKKCLAVAIFFLFIGISVFSSTGKNIESLSTDQKQLEYGENSISGCIEVYDAYAYFAYYPGGEEGLYGFNLEDPVNFTFLGLGNPDFLSGACFVPPCYIYFPQYGNGIMYALNVLTLDFYSIGGGGNGLNGLDYDDETGKLYGVSSYNLYEIDLESGAQTLIGGWSTSYMMIATAINNGICYGLDIITDAIYIIDLDTAELTLLGYTGLNLNYAQDMAFDKDNDILYLAAYTSTGQLYIINTTNGECTLVGNFPGGSQVSAFAITYGNIPPYVPCDFYPEDGEEDIPINVTLCWKGGDYNPEDNVTYDVYFGTTNPPTLKYSNQTETCYTPGYDLDRCKTYYWKIVAWDNPGLCTEGPILEFSTDCGNEPPSAPEVTGPNIVKVGDQYDWTFVSEDPEEGEITYYVDWGDECGGAEYYGPYASGEEIVLSHVYTTKATVIINTMAIDDFGAESDWTYYEVTVPRNKMLHNTFLQYLERFPFIQQLLNFLGWYN